MEQHIKDKSIISPDTIVNMFSPLIKQCSEHIDRKRPELDIQEKQGSDLVTNLDYEIEHMIIEYIKCLFPKDKIIAEESSVEKLTHSPTWIIDPIDGTVNFSYGSKLYGIQFCRVINKETELAIMYLPELNDLYYAVKGQGAYKNGHRLKTLDQLPLRLSLISFGDFSSSSSESRPYQMHLMDTLKEEVLKIRIFGSSCVDFCSVADGQTHCHIMFSRRIWEFKAGILLAEEAGLTYRRIEIKNTPVSCVCVGHNKDTVAKVEELLVNNKLTKG